MIAAGIVLMIAGVASIIYGVAQNDSMEAQFESIFNSGTKDPGNMWIIIGAVAAILGLVMLIAGLTKQKSADKGTSPKAYRECGTPANKETIVKPVRTCPKCKAEQEEDAAFCRLCGTSLTESKTVPEARSAATPVSTPVSSSWSGSAKDKGDRNAICPHCGARQSSGNTNCKYCGTPMQ